MGLAGGCLRAEWREREREKDSEMDRTSFGVSNSWLVGWPELPPHTCCFVALRAAHTVHNERCVCCVCVAKLEQNLRELQEKLWASRDSGFGGG